MDPNNMGMLLSREAALIFTIIHEFICSTDKHKRSDGLESFPDDFQRIPWRQVYKPPPPVAEAQSAAGATHPTMEHWQPSELPFGGAGPFWLFTVLPRIGENVSRKTEDGQTWSSKSGRGHKKRYPTRIWVDKLVISDKTFHMLEHTLNQEKPNVALCKIWRKGDISAVSSPHTMNLAALASTTDQEVENSPINEGLMTAMQMDQPQGIERQQMHDSPLSMSGYVLVDSTQALPVPDFTRGCIQWEDDDSIFQGAVSYLYEEKDSFKQVASCSKDKAHEMASEAQSLATRLRNMLSFLGIKKEPQSTGSKRTRTTDNQISGEANHVANTTAEPAPEATTTPQDHDDELAQQTEGYSNNSFTDQELAQLMDGYSMGNDTDQELTQLIGGQFIDDGIDNNYFFNPDEFINPDGAYPAN